MKADTLDFVGFGAVILATAALLVLWPAGQVDENTATDAFHQCAELERAIAHKGHGWEELIRRLEVMPADRRGDHRYAYYRAVSLYGLNQLPGGDLYYRCCLAWMNGHKDEVSRSDRASYTQRLQLARAAAAARLRVSVARQ